MRYQIGVIGYGHWGPCLARHFSNHPRCNLLTISDRCEDRLAEARLLYKNTKLVAHHAQMIKSPDINLIVIATPTESHIPIALEAIENGKHVWIAKPLASNSSQAKLLINRAKKMKLQVAVDHTLIFSTAVQKIKKMIKKKTLGELRYIDFSRHNLGRIQPDVNVFWDLASHDLAIIDYWLDSHIQEVSATGRDHYRTGHVDLGYLNLYYPDSFMAHLSMSWLAPDKFRRVLVAGSQGTLVWEEIKSENRLMFFKNKIDLIKDPLGKNEFIYQKNEGQSLELDQTDALKEAVSHFLDCLQSGKKPINNAESGLRVVRILEASDESLKSRGASVLIEPFMLIKANRKTNLTRSDFAFSHKEL